jgi:hypothetical protein
MAIGQEAKRFQSFYPRIQQLFELLEQVDNVPLKRKMRELVNGLEGNFLLEVDLEFLSLSCFRLWKLK